MSEEKLPYQAGLENTISTASSRVEIRFQLAVYCDDSLSCDLEATVGGMLPLAQVQKTPIYGSEWALPVMAECLRQIVLSSGITSEARPSGPVIPNLTGEPESPGWETDNTPSPP